MSKQNIVKHTPRNRGGLRSAEACVFNHQRQSNLRVVGRCKCGVERMVAQMLFELGGVVLVFLADRHRLGSSGLAPAEVAGAGKDAGRGAVLRDAHHGTAHDLHIVGLEIKVFGRLNHSRHQCTRDAVLGAENQARLVLDALGGQHSRRLRQLQHGECVVTLTNAQ